MPNESSSLRLALVTSSYNYIKDGVALTLNHLVDQLERQGVRVLVIAPVARQPAFAHRGIIHPVPSIPLPGRPEYRFAFGLTSSARRRLRDFQPDLIHIAVPDLLGYQALRFGAKNNIPIVASYHTRYETYLKHYWFRFGKGALVKYLRHFYNACRELYVPSPSMAEVLREQKITTAIRPWPRGVDAEFFHPAKRSAAWRERYRIPADELVVVFVGRLVREKQLDTLVEIFRGLAAAGVSYRSVVVGDGPDRSDLEKQLPQTTFTGFLNGEELASAYASSDIFLFPSDTETFGNVTLEAMASGLPCVCADATGSRSLVRHNVTGFLAAPGRAEEFVACLQNLARDPELRAQMSAAGRARSLEFTWEGAMSLILGYYRELVRQAPSAAAISR